MLAVRAFATSALLTLLAHAASCGGGGSSLENLFLADRVLNIAHRGGNLRAPEGTLEAFRSALEVGADVLEMDVRTTSDGVLVVLHDQTVDRTTDGTGRVNDLSFAQLRALDAGYRHTTDGGRTYPWRGAGVRVPTLEEVLQTFPREHMGIEIKAEESPEVIGPFVELLRHYGMADRVIVGSFSDDLMQTFRAAAPDVATSFALGEAIDFFFLSPEAEEGYQPPAGFLQVPPSFQGLEVMSPSFVAKAARFGLRIHVWDVFDAADFAAMIALGVDGLIVDDPETATEVIRRTAASS